MVSSSGLTQTASRDITIESLRLLSVNEARKLQQGRQKTVNISTESENQNEIIIESEKDNNPNLINKSECNRDELRLLSGKKNNSSGQYNELYLLSKRKAKAILGIGNESLNRLIANGDIKIIVVNGREKIPYVSVQEFIYNMQSKTELEAEEYKFIDEEEANIIATNILEEINKGGN